MPPSHALEALIVAGFVTAFIMGGHSPSPPCVPDRRVPVADKSIILTTGAVLVVTPFLFEASAAHMTANIAIGLLLAGLSLGRGTIRERYGSWDRRIILDGSAATE